MLKKLQRDRDKEFRHIAPGLIPAASIAPKPAVPRTPPPRSPDPSPERPRSALAAAILSSSLTGQTWAIPPTRTRSLSESDRSESFISEPNISTALYNRDRWSEDLGSRQDLSSSDHSDNELEDKQDKVENEEDEEDHIYQTLDGEATCSITEPLYALPLKSKTKTPLPTQIPDRGIPATESNRCSYNMYDCTALCEGKRRSSCPDFTEETSNQVPETTCSKKKVRKSSGRHKQAVPSVPAILTTDIPSQAKNQKHPTQLSPKPQVHSEVQREAVLPKKTRRADEQKLLDERVQRLEQEISQSKAFSTLRSSTGSQAEIQNLRQHAQELVDENDALKLTVHRLNVELSRYQTCFRPLSKQESSKISGLPKTGTPPPWLLDIKYLSPLLLAYDERMNEKDELLQTIEEEVKRLHVRLEEVVKENERLHDEMVKNGGFTQRDCHQLQQQAFLVLQENQILIDQLEAQHVKAKAIHSRHHSEVSKVSKQLMLLEAENQRLQGDLEESRTEVQKNKKQIQALQARQKDAVTWDEHCNITDKMKGQLEQLENRNKIEMDKLLLRVSSLQEENRSLALDKANLAADVERLEADVKLSRQAHRRTERMMNELKQQKKEWALQEEKTRHYLGEVINRAEHVSKERDHLLDMASSLKQEKKRFIDKILNGTLRLGKLQDEVKVYRRQASTRLAALEEAAEGKTASYQREILHLQRLLKERQEAEERLLQSKREIEDELEVVWQAATRENQHIKETILDLRFTPDFHGWSICDSASPRQPFWSPDKTTSSNQYQPHSSEPPLFTSNPSPALQRRSVFKSDSDCPNNCMDEKQKHSLDFYC